MLEQKIELLIAAVTENTAALREILSAGSVTTEAPTKAPAPVKKAKAAPAPEPEPELVPAADPVTDNERPTKVAAPAPAEDEFSDPLDPDTKVVVKGDPPAPKINPESVIAEITETWKAMLTAADPDRKMELKNQFPALRTKWGLADPTAKLSSLAGTPEKLVGLLNDIKSL